MYSLSSISLTAFLVFVTITLRLALPIHQVQFTKGTRPLLHQPVVHALYPSHHAPFPTLMEDVSAREDADEVAVVVPVGADAAARVRLVVLVDGDLRHQAHPQFLRLNGWLKEHSKNRFSHLLPLLVQHAALRLLPPQQRLVAHVFWVDVAGVGICVLIYNWIHATRATRGWALKTGVGSRLTDPRERDLVEVHRRRHVAQQRRRAVLVANAAAAPEADLPSVRYGVLQAALVQRGHVQGQAELTVVVDQALRYVAALGEEGRCLVEKQRIAFRRGDFVLNHETVFHYGSEGHKEIYLVECVAGERLSFRNTREDCCGETNALRR